MEILRFPPGTLVPVLWAAGLGRARGPGVAFTLGNIVVARPWAQALRSGLTEASGVGGPLVLHPQSGVVDWAIFYLRYSAFLPSQLPAGSVTGEIAGDNAAYLGSALERHASSFTKGFWEVEFHRRLRAEGQRLVSTRQATAAVTWSVPFWPMVRHRFVHGRHFGASRVAGGTRPGRIVFAAPLVPWILAARAARRVWSERGHRTRFVIALPMFVALAAAWAMGEAVGALFGPPRLQ